MIPFFVLIVSFALCCLLGWLGISLLHDWRVCLRVGLACMFLLTASAHWGRRRADLIRMVPPDMGNASLWVTATGILEIAGAIGLLIPATAQFASLGLSLLMIALFPANVRAARENIEIAGSKPSPLAVRLPLQIIFIMATLVAGGIIW